MIKFPHNRLYWNDMTPTVVHLEDVKDIFNPIHNPNFTESGTWTPEEFKAFWNTLLFNNELTEFIWGPEATEIAPSLKYLLIFVTLNPMFIDRAVIINKLHSIQSVELDIQELLLEEHQKVENYQKAIATLESFWNEIVYSRVISRVDIPNPICRTIWHYIHNKKVYTVDSRGQLLSPTEYANNPGRFEGPPTIDIGYRRFDLELRLNPDNNEHLKRLFPHSASATNLLSTPPNLYSKGRSDNRLYGVELEMASNLEVEDLIDAQEKPFAIYKDDSSISGSHHNRLEMVTAPMDLTSHRIAWAKWFKNVNDHHFDITLDTNNGLHVHIGREWFESKKHIKRFIWFFCNPAHFRFLLDISERDIESFRNWSDQPRFERPMKLTNYIKNCTSIIQDFRGIVFLSSRAPTIECRLFKGIVSYSSVVKALEFTDAVVEFTCSQTRYSHCTMPAFLDWLYQTPKNRYRILKEFLNHLDLEDAHRTYDIFSAINKTTVCSVIYPSDVNKLNKNLPYPSKHDLKLINSINADRHRPPLSFDGKKFVQRNTQTTVIKHLDPTSVDIYSKAV